jgi:hypothetical protein
MWNKMRTRKVGHVLYVEKRKFMEDGEPKVWRY